MADNRFSKPTKFLDQSKQMDFAIGKALFNRLWVAAPSSTQSADGLGPLFSARACSTCHINNGRGKPPVSEHETPVSLVFRIDIPPQNKDQENLLASHKVSNIAEPHYGLQLQQFSLPNLPSEYQLKTAYQETSITLSDGHTVHLRQPNYQFTHKGYGDFHSRARTSARIAQPLFGLGLLEKIPESRLEQFEDINDDNNDGISGRKNRVWSFAQNKVVTGRFGHKAGTVTVNEQSQKAFVHDIGISTSLFPDGAADCTLLQTRCRQLPNGNTLESNDVEASPMVTDFVSFYASHIAVPTPIEKNHEEVSLGQHIFETIGCNKCHVQEHVISINQQTHRIRPYTDLLLHDMGDGLADNRPEADASGHEWRTAPLWGIGLTPTISGHSYYLHDGRARNLLEAILWHNGEAKVQRDAVIALSTVQRQQLLTFIRSL